MYTHFHSQEHNGDAYGAATDTLDLSSAVSAVGRLCSDAVEMHEQIDRLQLLLDNKDVQLEHLDEKLAAIAGGGDDDDDAKNSTSAAASVIARAAVCTQTQGSSLSARCDACSRLLEAAATINDEMNALGLVDRADVGPPGQSPFQCTELCERYLRSAANGIRILASAKASWQAERDSSRKDKLAADERAAAALARAEHLETELTSVLAQHKQALAALTKQTEESIAQLKSDHAAATAAAAADAEAAARVVALKHAEELQSTREQAAVHVARLTKELLDANELSGACFHSVNRCRSRWYRCESVADIDSRENPI